LAGTSFWPDKARSRVKILAYMLEENKARHEMVRTMFLNICVDRCFIMDKCLLDFNPVKISAIIL